LALFLLDRFLPGRAYDRAKAQVTKELAEITISKEPVFEGAKDGGCVDLHGIGGSGRECSYEGEKLYKGINNLTKDYDILEIDKKLRSLGWRTNWKESDIRALSPKDGNNNQPLLLGNEEDIAYSKGGMGLTLMILDRDSVRNTTAAFSRSAFRNDRQITLDSDQEYAYVVNCSVVYSITPIARPSGQ
jgi:hypothetical protein